MTATTRPRAVAAGGGRSAGSSSSQAPYVARHGACGRGRPAWSSTRGPRIRRPAPGPRAHRRRRARRSRPQVCRRGGGPSGSGGIACAAWTTRRERRGGRGSPSRGWAWRPARSASTATGSPLRRSSPASRASRRWSAPAGAGLLVHNRLTHSLQVAQVARAIAERVACDPLVGEAGWLRPRRRRGGRAGPRPRPPAVRAPRRAGARPGGPRAPRPPRRLRGQRAELPHRHHHRPARPERHRARPHRRRARRRPQVPVDPARLPRSAPVRRVLPPRGGGRCPARPTRARPSSPLTRTELDDLVDCRAAFPVGPWQQTVEAAVMDTADDIAYAIHDLEDFHRVGVLQQAGVADGADRLGANTRAGVRPAVRPRTAAAAPAGQGRMGLRRRRVRAAVARVSDDLVDGLLAVPFDGSMAGERAVAEFSARWTSRLVGGRHGRR